MASSVCTHDPSTGAGLSRLRRCAFTGYHWLLLVFLLAGCAQIFLAGLGVFSFAGRDAAGGASTFDAHRDLGWAIALAAVIIFALALIARPGGLHALDGLIVLGIAGFLHATSRRRSPMTAT